MQITPGTRLGPYQIVSRIGAGGMGEVFEARDTRLDRVVAIKVLHSNLSVPPQVRERFAREARAISSLSHPHICTLFDVGEQDGVDYLVMEYLQGETLADHIARGPLPLADVLRYGAEIADALAKAHRQGVVHRDLKPGNVMVTKSGAKLLDFGLAKAAQSAIAADPNAATAGQPKPLTREGTVVGTAQYMSPEQLEGKEADTRTDLFALGCVLYEMTTGRRPFEGASTASLAAAILRGTPTPVSELQPLAPAALTHLISKCLAKDPDERWQSASDLTTQLRWIGENNGVARAESSRPPGGRRHDLLAWALALSMAMAAVVLAAILWRRSTPRPQPIHLNLVPPANTALSSDVVSHNIALSPDGTRVVFVAAAPGARPLLWARALSAATAHSVAGTEGATSPFWSPDGRFIAFFADGKLKRVAPPSGSAQTICDASLGSGSWGKDDTILFTETEGREGILRVPASGGVATPAIDPVPRRPAWHYWPQFLPDGRHFLYLGTNTHGERSLFVSSLDSKQRTAIPSVRSRALYASGFLIYPQEGVLLAREFNLRSMSVSGEPAIVAAEIPYFDTVGWSDFSVSSNGVLAYQGSAILSRLVWFDRAGREIGLVGDPAGYGSLRLSPDNKKLAFSRADPKTLNDDLWVYDLGRNLATRFTFDPGDEFDPVWNRDGDRIIYALDVQGNTTLYEKKLTESGRGTALLPMERFKVPRDCSPDGGLVLYSDTGSQTGYDLWMMPLDGERKPHPFQQTRFDETDGVFSPDSRWVAFVSAESGSSEVYVQRSDGSGEKWRISSTGGSGPRWPRDGKEIFYLAADNRIMAVPVSVGETFSAGKAVALFTADPVCFKCIGDTFDVTHDGQRFLVNNRLPGPSSAIDIVLNWVPDSKK